MSANIPKLSSVIAAAPHDIKTARELKEAETKKAEEKAATKKGGTKSSRRKKREVPTLGVNKIRVTAEELSAEERKIRLEEGIVRVSFPDVALLDGETGHDVTLNEVKQFIKDRYRNVKMDPEVIHFLSNRDKTYAR